MTSLLDVERAFAAVLRGDASAAGQLALAGPPARHDACLGIYCRSVETGRAEALAAAYPVTRALVGADCFDQLARRHARTSISTSGDLNDYGRDFPAFLAAEPSLAGLPYLQDVARLEWAMLEVARAPACAPFPFAALAAVPPSRHGELRFQLCPACKVISSLHPLLAIYRLGQGEEAAAPLAWAEAPGTVLVIRRADGIALETLAAARAALCEAFANGETFAAAIGAALAREPGSDIAVTLQALIAEGVVAGMSV